MSVLPTLATPGPWHMLAFGTLLGSQFYQSFIAGPAAYGALARPHFSHLQQKIFPIYFTLQTILPAVLLLTHPRFSATALILPQSPPFWSAGLPLLLVLTTSLTNLAFVGPATTKIMHERKVQETREGKKYHDDGPKSDKMALLNKRFGMAHGVSSMLNLVGLLATGWYGVVLGSKLKF